MRSSIVIVAGGGWALKSWTSLAIGGCFISDPSLPAASPGCEGLATPALLATALSGCESAAAGGTGTATGAAGAGVLAAEAWCDDNLYSRPI